MSRVMFTKPMSPPDSSRIASITTLAQKLGLVAPHPPAFAGPFAFIGGCLERPGRLAVLLLLFGKEMAEVLANYLRGSVLMNPLRPQVPILYVSVTVKNEDRVIGDALDYGAEPPLAFNQGSLRHASLGNVLLERGF